MKTQSALIQNFAFPLEQQESKLFSNCFINVVDEKNVIIIIILYLCIKNEKQQ